MQKHIFSLCSPGCALKGFAVALASAFLFGCAVTENSDAAKDEKTAAPAVKKEAALSPAQKARMEKMATFRELQNLLRTDIPKKHKKCIDRVVEAKKMLKDPKYADPDCQRILLDQIVSWCYMPGWTDIRNYDPAVLDAELVSNAKDFLGRTDIRAGWKRYALNKLAVYYCGKGQYAEAEKVVRDFLAKLAAEKNPEEEVFTLNTLADVYRLQDRYDDAVKVMHEVAKRNPIKGLYGRADLAVKFDKMDQVEPILNENPDPYVKIMYYVPRQKFTTSRYSPMMHAGHKLNWANDWVQGPGQKLAVEYAQNLKNDEAKRVEVVLSCLFWFNGTPEMDNARRSIFGAKSLLNRSNMHWMFKTLVIRRQFELTLELFDLCKGAKYLENKDILVCRMTALGGLKRYAEAATAADACAKAEKVTPTEELTFRLCAAFLRNQDTEALLKNSPLNKKEQAAAVCEAGRLALLWQLNEVAEKLSDKYENFYGEKIERTLPVRFVEKPVTGFQDWRDVYSKLEKQYSDVPFRISMDFLIADVATGRGPITLDKNAKEVNLMEITSLCDISGLHIYLRVKDENARKVQYGFASGYVTEMYFAPGRNQPYTCFGGDPTVNHTTYCFGTTYDGKNQRRLDEKRPDTSFKIETQFTDEDYVQHLFFAWDDLYNKLPENGTEYRFECISFTPAGIFSWGGSHAVHAASAWGSLKFELTKAQVNAIRKHVLLRTARNYKKVPRDILGSVSLFTIWGDPEIGDPEFYKTVLAPLEKELDSYAAMVKPDMSEEDVETVTCRALPRMKGLKDEVDQLRRKYLLKRITETGR